MNHTTGKAVAGTALSLVLLLGACGSDEPVSTDTTSPPTTTAPGGDDSVVTSPPMDPTDPMDPGDPGELPETTWERIEHTEDLRNPQPSAIEELLVDPDDDTVVLVRFWSGVPDCYAARASVVSEADEQVVVLLETGGNPDAPEGAACIMLAVAQELAITLDAPLGDRELVAEDVGPAGIEPATLGL